MDLQSQTGASAQAAPAQGAPPVQMMSGVKYTTVQPSTAPMAYAGYPAMQMQGMVQTFGAPVTSVGTRVLAPTSYNIPAGTSTAGGTSMSLAVGKAGTPRPASGPLQMQAMANPMYRAAPMTTLPATQSFTMVGAVAVRQGSNSTPQGSMLIPQTGGSVALSSRAPIGYTTAGAVMGRTQLSYVTPPVTTATADNSQTTPALTAPVAYQASLPVAASSLEAVAARAKDQAAAGVASVPPSTTTVSQAATFAAPSYSYMAPPAKAPITTMSEPMATAAPATMAAPVTYITTAMPATTVEKQAAATTMKAATSTVASSSVVMPPTSAGVKYVVPSKAAGVAQATSSFPGVVQPAALAPAAAVVEKADLTASVPPGMLPTVAMAAAPALSAPAPAVVLPAVTMAAAAPAPPAPAPAVVRMEPVSAAAVTRPAAVAPAPAPVPVQAPPVAVVEQVAFVEQVEVAAPISQVSQVVVEQAVVVEQVAAPIAPVSPLPVEQVAPVSPASPLVLEQVAAPVSPISPVVVEQVLAPVSPASPVLLEQVLEPVPTTILEPAPVPAAEPVPVAFAESVPATVVELAPAPAVEPSPVLVVQTEIVAEPEPATVKVELAAAQTLVEVAEPMPIVEPVSAPVVEPAPAFVVEEPPAPAFVVEEPPAPSFVVEEPALAPAVVETFGGVREVVVMAEEAPVVEPASVLVVEQPAPPFVEEPVPAPVAVESFEEVREVVTAEESYELDVSAVAPVLEQQQVVYESVPEPVPAVQQEVLISSGAQREVLISSGVQQEVLISSSVPAAQEELLVSSSVPPYQEPMIVEEAAPQLLVSSELAPQPVPTGGLEPVMEAAPADALPSEAEAVGGDAAVEKRVADLELIRACKTNTAFVFVKPHAVNDTMVVFVKDHLTQNGISVISEGVIPAEDIDRHGLIDTHYGSIAAKAMQQSPAELALTPQAHAEFQARFGLSWEAAIQQNLLFNAADAAAALRITPEELGARWSRLTKGVDMVKLAGGFYCGRIGRIFVINGFYMDMRSQYTAPGRCIHYIEAEWDPKQVSWEIFRRQIVGATDPTAAEAGSMRNIVFAEWTQLGLPQTPDTGSNGVHASASPFEALVERANWMGIPLPSDPYCRAMVAAGIPLAMIEHWTSNPDVTFEGQRYALFDLLEDLDSKQCLQRIIAVASEFDNALPEGTQAVNAPIPLEQRLADLEIVNGYSTHSAFTFIKPHAVNANVAAFVRDHFAVKGISVTNEGIINAEEIDQLQVIDRHYGAIADKAMRLKPEELVVQPEAKAEFQRTFGLPWESALQRGAVHNALDAAAMLGLSHEELSARWSNLTKGVDLVKFGGGFYCGRISNIFVINGFYMDMRSQYTAPGRCVHYMEMEWDPKYLPWERFRSQVVGATDPQAAEPDSLRASIMREWQSLGLDRCPNTGLNGVHASAGPFEALAERTNWVGSSVADDPFGKAILAVGVPLATINYWFTNPDIVFDGRPMPIFDALEDCDAKETLQRLAAIANDPQNSPPEIQPAEPVALEKRVADLEVAHAVKSHTAFTFVKPHAMTDATKDFMRQHFLSNGVHIVSEGQINSEEIAQLQLIDRHYGAIADKAVKLKPYELSVQPEAQAEFERAFGLTWDAALQQAVVFNAADAAAALGISDEELGVRWGALTRGVDLIKFGGGFYCGLLENIFVINGFYMSMRSKFTAPGQAIHYMEVEWEPRYLAWQSFRAKVVGATDPTAAEQGSLRSVICQDWAALGLQRCPDTGDNGVHASASPFEAMAERINWLGGNIADDPFGKAMTAAGVPLATVEFWCTNPEVNFEGGRQPIFDLLEDLDARSCLMRLVAIASTPQDGMPEAGAAGSNPDEFEKRLADLEVSHACETHAAFCFIKPHAVNEHVRQFVKDHFLSNGISVVGEGQIPAEEIDQHQLIDRHYGAIAEKAVSLKPEELIVQQDAKDEFARMFGLAWDAAVQQGMVYNAVHACEKLGLTPEQLCGRWNGLMGQTDLINFGGGCYCGKINGIFVINGFYLDMRSQYTTPGNVIYYLETEWDPKYLSWEDFRSKVLGAEDPETAESGSLRSVLLEAWQSFGLERPPDASENAMHASPSPFEALAERINWLGEAVSNDYFGKALLAAGVPLATIRFWCTNPDVEFEGKRMPIFDLLEDLDVRECLHKALAIAADPQNLGSENEVAPFTTAEQGAPLDKRLADLEISHACKTHTAFTFVKPHAVTEPVINFVRDAFLGNGISCVTQGGISAEEIDQHQLIDKHYGAIAEKAVRMQPAELSVGPQAQSDFQTTFGVPWDVALQQGLVFNAMDAAQQLGLRPEELGTMWSQLVRGKNMIKFGGGFYCGKIGSIFVINGFYMDMRGKYTCPGRSIHYIETEWDPKRLSWQAFRSKIVGATDPMAAEQGSLRRAILENWQNFGLAACPDTGDNGVHASASPLEALAERLNWMGTTIADDFFGKAILAAGVSQPTVEYWCTNPEVVFEGEARPIFDLVEDLDARQCLQRMLTLTGDPQNVSSAQSEQPVPPEKRLADLEVSRACKAHSAFVFVKPHAANNRVTKLVSDHLAKHGISVLSEGLIPAEEIDQHGLVDRHYGAIADRAVRLRPEELSVSPEAQDAFHRTFGLPWVSAVQQGEVFNAVDAAATLGVGPEELSERWSQLKRGVDMLKFGGGFYCGKIGSIFVINGFYMAMRAKFTTPGTGIQYLETKWDPKYLSWADFRAKIIGATDPAEAEEGSLRSSVRESWISLGLQRRPDTGDNGVHASASPFEAMVERVNWLANTSIADDFYGKALLAVGVPLRTIEEWCTNPDVLFEDRRVPIFDLLEDLDGKECLQRALAVLAQNM